MITTFYPPYHFGGDAIAVARLVRALALRGHRVDVIHNADAYHMLGGKPVSESYEELEGVTIHRLQSRSALLSCLLTQQTGRPGVYGSAIRRVFRENDFDVIHFHNTSLVGGPGVLSEGQGIKLYTAHEHWLVCPTHVLWRHDRELCTSRQCLRCAAHYRRPPQLWRHTGFMKKKLQHIDAFISPSCASAEKHAEFGFPRRFEVIPHFLPNEERCDSSERQATNLEGDRPYYLFVGRLEKLKGLQDVLPQFSEDFGADLLVAGDGNYEGPLRGIAADNPRIRFLGRRTPQQLRALYQQAIAVVVPSLTYETFGLVIVEAFRERTPVIARSLGPLKEIVEQSQGGLLFGSPEELGAGLRRLAGNRKLRNSLGNAGYDSFQSRWTEEVVIEKYFQLIRNIALRRGSVELSAIIDEAQGSHRDDPSKQDRLPDGFA